MLSHPPPQHPDGSLPRKDVGIYLSKGEDAPMNPVADTAVPWLGTNLGPQVFFFLFFFSTV